MTSRLFAGLAPVLFMLVVAPRLQAAPCLPVPPDQILSFLPKPPPGWELKKSQAWHSMSDWLVTQALREYERVQLEGAVPPPGSEEAGPAKVQLRFTDTARFPAHLELFENFSVGKEGHIEGVTISSYPAFIHDFQAKGAMVEILIEKRFIARFRLENVPVKAVVDWLKAMNFDAIRSARGADVTRLPEEMELLTVYELDPEKNKARATELITSAEVARILEAAAREEGQGTEDDADDEEDE